MPTFFIRLSRSSLQFTSGVMLLVLCSITCPVLCGCKHETELETVRRIYYGQVDGGGRERADRYFQENDGDVVASFLMSEIDSTIAAPYYNQPHQSLPHLIDRLRRSNNPIVLNGCASFLTAPDLVHRVCGAIVLGHHGDCRAAGPLLELLVAIEHGPLYGVLGGDFGRSSWQDYLDPAEAALDSIKGSCLEDSLLARIDSQDIDERKVLIKHLGRFRDERARRALCTAAKDADYFVRYLALCRLANFTDPESQECIFRGARDASYTVRGAAAQALGTIKGDRARQQLVLLLRDNGNGTVDETAAYWLSKRPDLAGDPAAREALASHAVPRLRLFGENDAAMHLLSRIAWRPVTPVERTYWWIATRDTARMRSEWSWVYPLLLEELAIGRKKQGGALIAALTLVRMKEPLAAPELIRYLDEAGSLELANAFLNSGNNALKAASIRWANLHGCRLVS